MRDSDKFGDGWLFHDGDLPPFAGDDGGAMCFVRGYDSGATAINYEDAFWRSVRLPHDFVLDGNYQYRDIAYQSRGTVPAMAGVENLEVYWGSLPGGIGWYRRHFIVDSADKGRRIYLRFDGVYRDCTIYLNQYRVGRHSCGYTAFYHDITDFLLYGEENLLAVRVDASGHQGWWYEGGGIYRNVSLIKTDPVHFTLWGTAVRSEYREQDGTVTASVNIAAAITNRTTSDVSCSVNVRVFDPRERLMGEATVDASIACWSEGQVEAQISFEHPALWSTVTPNLHRMEAVLLHAKEQVDKEEILFGIRNVRFDADEGFFLNDRSMKLNGVCCHQDHAGVGIAVTAGIIEYRMRKLKEMGCNAYRCAHHPPSAELLDLCDRLGLLVIDEKRVMSSSEEDLRQLRDMVARDRNHPCVILWSIGNEEIFAQQRQEGARIARTMRNTVRKLDRTRPVTLAVCYWNGEPILDASTLLPIARELDVMGINYSPDLWDRHHEAMPHQPIVITEATTRLSTRGRSATDRDRCFVFGMDDHLSNWRAGEDQWKKAAEMPWICGAFLWTGFDYRGEPVPYGWPAIGSQFGIMDSCGYPKDSYFYYRSCWSREPLVHLFPHWNRSGEEGRPVDIFCFSNCSEVELFLNGRSVGRKSVETNRHLVWRDVPYEPGTLLVYGYRSGDRVAECRLDTAGPPSKIVLTADRSRIRADGVDVCMLTAGIADDRGRLVPTAENPVHFFVVGNGRMLGTGNGNPASHESDTAPVRNAFAGLCQLIVQSDGRPGEITVRALSDGLQGCDVVIHAD